jgi:hypothetical protein
MSGPKVKKVIDLEDKTKYKPIHGHLPHPPFLLLMAGSVRSGKTNALVGLLRDEEMFGDKYWDIVKIYSNSIYNDPKGKYLMDVFDVEDGYKDSYIDKFIESQKKQKREDMSTALLVFDDIINKDFKKNNSISFLASRFRHIETSIIIAVQSFRAISPIIRSNATNIMVFKQQSAGKKGELAKIIEEYSDLAGSEQQFIDYYHFAINSEPYSFLYIDAQQNPARFYNRFETLIGEGSKSLIPKQEVEDVPFDENNDNNVK